MDQQTQVKNVKVRSRAERLKSVEKQDSRVVEVKTEGHWTKKLFRLESLGRNLVVTGCLFMVVVAVKNTQLPQTQSVFSALQASAGMEWDESVGKLSFVNSLLPQGIQTVWNAEAATSVFSPLNGNVVHAWSREEPYVMIAGKVSDVRAAADGEVMSIAHGLDEERIVRIRHDDESESLYGNLSVCFLQEGDRVYAGDVFAKLQEGKPLAFELRVEGRSVDPEGVWHQMQE